MCVCVCAYILGLAGVLYEFAGLLRRSILCGAPPKRNPQIQAFQGLGSILSSWLKNAPKEPSCFCFCVCFGHFLKASTRCQTGNSHHNTEFRFVDLEHAKLCLESTIHDISCHSSGNNSCKILLQ